MTDRMRVTHVDAECRGGKAQPKCRCPYHSNLTHLNNMKRGANENDVKAINADLTIIKAIGCHDFNENPMQCEGQWSWFHKDKLDSVQTATSLAAAAPTRAAPTHASTTIDSKRLQSDTTLTNPHTRSPSVTAAAATAAPTTAAPTYAPTTATATAIKLNHAERLLSDTTKSITRRDGPAPATAAGESLPLSTGDIASTAAHVAGFLAYLQGIEQNRNKDKQVTRT
jgi:hypothetical protein